MSWLQWYKEQKQLGGLGSSWEQEGPAAASAPAPTAAEPGGQSYQANAAFADVCGAFGKRHGTCEAASDATVHALQPTDSLDHNSKITTHATAQAPSVSQGACASSSGEGTVAGTSHTAGSAADPVLAAQEGSSSEESDAESESEQQSAQRAGAAARPHFFRFRGQKRRDSDDARPVTTRDHILGLAKVPQVRSRWHCTAFQPAVLAQGNVSSGAAQPLPSGCMYT